jgi:hypothetical protein
MGCNCNCKGCLKKINLMETTIQMMMNTTDQVTPNLSNKQGINELPDLNSSHGISFDKVMLMSGQNCDNLQLIDGCCKDKRQLENNKYFYIAIGVTVTAFIIYFVRR